MKDVTCKDCGNVYGSFRHRCPACGTSTPHCKHGMTPGLCAVCTGTVRAVEQRLPKRGARGTAKQRQRDAPDACILCRRRVKDNKKGTRCPHCNERIHVDCLEVHRDSCLTFQFEREAELRKLDVKGGVR